MSTDPFVPADFTPPTALDHPSFRLRPLGPEHNERDHAAWSGSLDHVRATPGFPDGTWPSPMSLHENLEDLRRHRDDFDRRVGFTYTVLAPDGPVEQADVIGCVYVYPDDEPGSDVHVQSWVREDHARLDATLATTVRAWLEGTWPWTADRIRDHRRRSVVYALGISLDGYAMDQDGAFDWSAPDPELFRFATEQVRGLGAHLLGRRLHETMLYWETVDEATLDDDERAFAALWRALPKVVFSRSLTSVRGSNTRLATGGLAAEVARLREGEGDIAIGGPTLAAEAARLDLIDEYQPRIHPVLVGGGVRYFADEAQRRELELVETRTFGARVVHARYRVVR